jgi:hypothetical protein
MYSVQVCVVPPVIFVYIDNGRLDKTACRHQIFFKLMKNVTETFKMFKEAL